MKKTEPFLLLVQISVERQMMHYDGSSLPRAAARLHKAKPV